MPRIVRYRFSLYVLINVAFALIVGVGYAASGLPNPRLVHLILLFALCSAPVVDLDGLNGRYALLALFMFVFFVSYGVGDLTNLFMGSALPALTSTQPASNLMNETEAVILVGGIVWVLGYRMVSFMVNALGPARVPRDWSKGATVSVGLVFWVIGTTAMYRWNVYIVTDTTNEAFRKGLASISTATVTAYIVGQMCQPLGMLLLAYAWSVFRSRYLMVLVIAVVAVQLFIGFVVDIKGMAMLGLILVILTSILVDGRLPKAWLAVGVIFVSALYPYFTAYRTAVHGAGIARTAVVENFGKALQKTIEAKDKVNTGHDRAQTFWERGNVKGSVQVAVERTGNEAPFQGGHTLSPILGAFTPRILGAEKERVPTGQLFNKAFHLFDSDDIFVSPSYLGELYWNFGWAGVVLGMALLGLMCGWVGVCFNLAEFKTVTRVLVTAITIKQLIVGFEGTIADNYVVWLRSLVGIGILHLVLARVLAASRLFPPTNSGPEAMSADRPPGGRLFPNLST
jgi:hypothetical protein